MRVMIDGIIFQIQKYGGISRVFYEMMPRVCELDQSVQFLLYTDGVLLQDLPYHPQIIQKSNFPIHSFLKPRKLWAPWAPAIRQAFQKRVMGDGLGAIWHSTFFTLPLGWKGKQVVTVYDTIHEKFAHLFNGEDDHLFRKEKKECIEQADAVITISETTRQDVHKFYGTPLASIFPAHLACGEIFKVLKNEEKQNLSSIIKPFILYVGGRTHYKNFDLLAKAFSIWPQRGHVQLIIVGDLFSRAEEKRLRELKIHQDVRVMTQVNDETLCQLYNQAAVFIYPSLYEGFGIPLLEAMSCGCPIVASRIPATEEIALDIPIYFEPTSIDGLIQALDQALSEHRGIKRMGQGIRHAETFSWDKTAQETLSVYQEISS